MFADIEQEIVNRLKAKLPAGTTVGTQAELERVEQLRQKAPAVWVIYDGYTVGRSPTPQTGHVQEVTQEWYVVCCAKSAKGNGHEIAARNEAGELASAALSALLGYHLGGGRYLRLSDAPGPEYDGGYCHVPLAFTCSATFRGQP